MHGDLLHARPPRALAWYSPRPKFRRVNVETTPPLVMAVQIACVLSCAQPKVRHVFGLWEVRFSHSWCVPYGPRWNQLADKRSCILISATSGPLATRGFSFSFMSSGSSRQGASALKYAGFLQRKKTGGFTPSVTLEVPILAPHSGWPRSPSHKTLILLAPIMRNSP